MAGVRDPAFWKRFSMAVHMDEENGSQGQTELKHSDSWLGRQQRKRNRRTCICWIFWVGFFIVVAAIIAVIIWLVNSGVLDNIGGDDDADGASSRRLR